MRCDARARRPSRGDRVPLALDALDEVHGELPSQDAEVPLATAPGDLTGVSAPDDWRGDGIAYRQAAASFDLYDPRIAANT